MLRGGILSTIELSRKKLAAMMGNQNCHAEITFQDNVKWLARFRLARTSPPPWEVRDWILRSEAATMTYLQQHTRIPVPGIFDWACDSDPGNPLGVGYILMEELDGKPLDWQAATPAQREKVMQQLVDTFLEIEKASLSSNGITRLLGRGYDRV
jgi:aminoglycoside phosphotransferase (APT) family kinase protein